MKTWVRRSLNVGVLGAGFLLVSGAAAQADQVSGPNAGVLSGNQLSSVLQLPIDVSGNAISVLGFADASSVGGAGAVNAESAPVTEAGQVSGFNTGILSGNQVSSVVQVPVSVCGNSVAVLGFANASCVGGAGAVNGGGGGNGGWDNDGNGSGSGGYGSGSGGYGSGSGGYGNADADDDGYGGGGGRSNDYNEHGNGGGMGGGSGALSNGGADQVTGYNAGLVSGNQVSSVIQAPIDVSGNAIALFGFASAASVGGAGAMNESAPVTEAGQVSGFNAGILTGNQISSVVQVPISVCGNSIAILGFADASCVGGAGAINGGGGWDNDRDRDRDDDDNDGGATPSGNYYGDPSGGRPMAHGAHGASKAAKNAGKKAKHGNEHGNWGGRGRHHGNGAGASDNGYGGSGSGGYNGGGSGSGSGGNGNGGSWGGGGSCGPDQITGFNGGILSGNQVSNVVQLPIDISGNAISVLGFASASSVGGAAAVNC
jgi:hypothetical protein